MDLPPDLPWLKEVRPGDCTTILGLVRSLDGPREVETKSGRPAVLCEVILGDETALSFRLTLWGPHAESCSLRVGDLALAHRIHISEYRTQVVGATRGPSRVIRFDSGGLSLSQSDRLQLNQHIIDAAGRRATKVGEWAARTHAALLRPVPTAGRASCRSTVSEVKDGMVVDLVGTLQRWGGLKQLRHDPVGNAWLVLTDQSGRMPLRVWKSHAKQIARLVQPNTVWQCAKLVGRLCETSGAIVVHTTQGTTFSLQSELVGPASNCVPLSQPSRTHIDSLSSLSSLAALTSGYPSRIISANVLVTGVDFPFLQREDSVVDSLRALLVRSCRSCGASLSVDYGPVSLDDCAQCPRSSVNMSTDVWTWRPAWLSIRDVDPQPIHTNDSDESCRGEPICVAACLDDQAVAELLHNTPAHLVARDMQNSPGTSSPLHVRGKTTCISHTENSIVYGAFDVSWLSSGDRIAQTLSAPPCIHRSERQGPA